MIIYPAIDLRGGRCVRLIEGDFARELTFDADPVDAARRWQAAGAEWLHIVDLDGAVAGEPVNLAAIERIRAAVDLPIQLGGGLRRDEHLAIVFALGISRVILGTVALKRPDLVERAVGEWGDRIAVGLDARDGLLAAEGWTERTTSLVADVANALTAAGVTRFVYTDIARDGTLSGPNLPAIAALARQTPAKIIAAGGAGSLADVEAVAALGIEGIVIGRALYDGRIDLTQAIALVAAKEPIR